MDVAARNCIILGSGRSGSSMVAGLLSTANYFMGVQLHPGREGNPKGYFEDVEVNNLNEDILGSVLRRRPRADWGRIFFWRLKYGQGWLAELPINKTLSCSEQDKARIKKLVEREPFCFKDPRFCYTLPVWRPYINQENVVHIVTFRDPLTTATSMIKEAKHGYPEIKIDVSRCLRIWHDVYNHILNIHYPKGGKWLFFNSKQFFINNKPCKKLEDSLSISLDSNFLDNRLQRSMPASGVSVPEHVKKIYTQLCTLAGYEEAVETRW